MKNKQTTEPPCDESEALLVHLDTAGMLTLVLADVIYHCIFKKCHFNPTIRG